MPDRPSLPDPATLDAIEDAEVSLGTVRAFRVLVLRAGQAHADAGDFFRENTLGARWNPPGTPALYTSRERETAGAEGAHLLAVNGPTGRFQLGELVLRLERVVDLNDDQRLNDVGLARPDVEDDDHTRCRLVGSACAWLGMSGLLVPSARRWPATNLVVFTRNLSATEGIEPAGEPADWDQT